MNNYLINILSSRTPSHPVGIYSACTASKMALLSVLEAGCENNTPVLIEATANQCNQFGGYTGMKPDDFSAFVKRLVNQTGFPENLLILGGDHLGPLSWQSEPEITAMSKSEELVYLYVMAGFTKIHIDTSMKLADDDPDTPLSGDIIAKRAARLASVCENAYLKRRSKYPGAPPLAYVIGSEVPIPGGSQEEDDSISVTTPQSFQSTYETFQVFFEKVGLNEAFSRVVAVVVQPGVEFSDKQIIAYHRPAAAALIKKLNDYPGLIFEGHSTDYQTPKALREMVEDGIGILKVGPALTFYMREAIFALCEIEKEMRFYEPSYFKEILEETMQRHPENWLKHYRGTDDELYFKRKYSFSDRSRYYFNYPEVKNALSKLVYNIDKIKPPLSLLSQYLPTALARLRNTDKPICSDNLIKARIRDCIDDYLYATTGL